MTMDMERARAGLERARRCRWAGVGRSAHADAVVAGREAARAALGENADAHLLIVFASGRYDLRPLAAEVSDVAAGIPVVGCSSAGEIDASGAGRDSVVVLALGGDGFSFSATAVSAAEDARDAGARAAACVGDVADREHRVLMLLTDGPAEAQTDVVRGAYSVAGAGVPLVGGLGGTPEPGGRPALIYGGAILTGAVVGVAIGSDAPIGVGVRHGWRPVGDPMLITRALPDRLLELDGRPAAEVYRERLGGRQPYAVTLMHPLGLERRGGEAHVRFVVDDDAPDGSLDAAIPAGSMVWVMEADRDDVRAATDAACREALDALGDEPAQALIVFDCDARMQSLGADAERDVAQIVAHAGDATVGGLYTWGEIARTRGSAGFHQQTLVVLALA
ncbi:hypothetical protein DSM104299_05431 [Baekduia alba]|uniref:FIST signal transduction protein n=1 Tax=Baekduia alba TaxID=2997333 RepID=UPI00233FD3AA|nr:FIST N-terminal domain-containing protein [Baekduia alba]WCB96666.1 hypothetical protein DSM104299_05431 [Baekduia alba]